MGRNRRPLLRCVVWVTGALICMGMIGGAEVAVQKTAPAQKGNPEPLTENQKILKLLDKTLDTKLFESIAGLSLKDFINQVYYKFEKQGLDLPILIDFEAFKQENPEVYKEPGDLYDIKVTIPQVPKRLTLRRILELGLGNIPTNNATWIVRKGTLEITTQTRAAPCFLISLPVAAVFNNRRLGDALQELSGSTGLPILASSRVANPLDTPISATFANSTPLKAAVGALAEMADLKVVELPGALFITTADDAEAMRKERKAQEQEKLWRRRHKLPEINPPVPVPKAADAGV